MAYTDRKTHRPDHLYDIEASIGRVALDVDVEDAQQGLEANNNDAPKAKSDCIISIYVISTFFMMYVFIMIVGMFVGPRLIYKQSNDGFTSLAKGLGVIFTFGVSALAVATVSFMLTLCRWKHVPQRTKIIGLFPMICSVSIVVAATVLLSIVNDDGGEVPPCYVYSAGDSACPTPKNHTVSFNNV